MTTLWRCGNARSHVAAADGPRDPLADLAEDLITGGVPQPMVKTGEAIDVDAEKTDRAQVALGKRDGSRDLSEREPPVR